MKLKNILNDDHETFYWVGFILADGYITKTNRLKVIISIKDKEHLEKLGKFLGLKIGRERDAATLIKQDKKIITEFKKKFEISNNKTYNPPSLEMFLKIENDLLMSLIIGFIDGDGSIRYQTGRTDSSLMIKNHNSWLKILQIFADTIMKNSGIKFPIPKTNNQGYASLTCANLRILQFLKKHSLIHNLPILNRKWDKIDMNRVSREDPIRMGNVKREALILRDSGLTYDKISEIIGLSSGRIWRILNENKTKC